MKATATMTARVRDRISHAPSTDDEAQPIEQPIDDVRPTPRVARASGLAFLQWGTVTGLLVGLRGTEQLPLVVFEGQEGTAAVQARTMVDLDASQIGREI